MAYLTNTVKNKKGKNIYIDDFFYKKDYFFEGDTEHKKILPSGYTQVDYIQNTSGAYIDTGYVPDYTNGFRIEVEYEPTVASQRYCVLSSYNGANHISLEVTTGNKSRFYYKDGTIDNSIGTITLSKNKVVVDYTNNSIKHIANGTQSTPSGTLSGTTPSLYMFVDRDKRFSTFTQPLRIYSCKLYNNGTLVRNFIPCYRNSDSVVGMYDVVNNVFYVNEGTETLTYGSVSPTPNSQIPIEVVTGEQNIKISNKNLIDTTAYNKAINGTTGAIQTPSTPSNYLSFDDYVAVKPNTTYTISFEDDDSSARLYLGSKDINGNFIERINLGSVRTFTTGASAYQIFIYLYKSGGNFEAGGWVQLEYGNQATNYAEHKEQNYEINLGKNLCDTNTFTLTKGTNRTIQFYFPEPLEAGTYTISWKIKNQSGFTSSTGMGWNYYDGSTSPSTNLGAITTINSNSPTTGSYTRTLTGSATYIYAYIDNSLPDDATITIEDLQVERGDQATSYSEYFTPIELAKINTYKDRIFKNTTDSNLDTDAWYIEKKIGKVVLNGTENWELATLSNTKTYQITSWNGGQDTSIAYQFYSNYFKPKTYWSTLEVGMALERNLLVTTQDCLDGTYDVDNFKTWLSTHNTIIYYVLDTPTYTKITNQELISQLESIRLFTGVNNISISSNDLSADLNLTYYSQENDYEDVIYSEDDRNDIKIWFNDVELENAGDYVELLTKTSRILPNDGKKRFSLANFISTELELTIHDIDIEDIQDQVEISIGTLVNNEYVYIPLGVFNIQDEPVNNNGKYIIKLRDNRVKFEFNYDAKPLIDNQYKVTEDTHYLINKEYYSLVSSVYVLLVEGTDYEIGDEISGTIYDKKGTATKRQILDDICYQAGVEHEVYHFDGEDDEIGIYDNSIKGNVYIAYLAEQCGQVPVINRYGKLIFIDLSDAVVWRIPLRIVSDDYRIGDKFKIDRVVYESGIIKYESSNNEALGTLFLNSANPYITSQEQIDLIYNKLKDFEIDSISLNNSMLGNPEIDPYDIIEVYDDEDANGPIIFRTLANNFYTFNGTHIQTFDTQIGIEERKENVTKNSEETFRRWTKTEIDNADARIDIEAGRIDVANESIAQLQINTESISSQVTNVTNDLQNQITTQQLTITQTANDLTIEQSKTTSLETAVSELQDTSAANSQDLVVIKNYVFYDGVTGVLTLGERNSNFKLELKGGDDGEIRFMGNGVKLGYFNRSRLYVENTTVFNEQVIAQKGNEEDCNYYWHVTDDGCLDLDYGGTEE